jgi:hypothetical protein
MSVGQKLLDFSAYFGHPGIPPVGLWLAIRRVRNQKNSLQHVPQFNKKIYSPGASGPAGDFHSGGCSDDFAGVKKFADLWNI